MNERVPEPRIGTGPTMLTLPDGQNVAASGVTLDSRRVAPGDLWVALPGTRVHGARFARQAVDAGAVAILTDAEGAEQIRAEGPLTAGDGAEVAVAVSPDPRRDMAVFASRVHQDPSTTVQMFGLTGTNGKTTTVHLMAALLRQVGLRVGTIGTLGFELDGVRIDQPTSTVTTPESPDLQAMLAQMRDRGAEAVAMEVSSHALALNRVDGIEFAGAGFTNLNREHLDFHGTMEEYFEVKARLFTPHFTHNAVVHMDDPWAAQLIERARANGLRLRTVGRSEQADYRILPSAPDEFSLQHPGGTLTVPMRLPGMFNRTNAAIAMALVDGQVVAGQLVTPEAVAPALATVDVPGRMQPVPLGDRAPEAYVDFAHTPESVAAVLGAFTEQRQAGRRVVVVVGCGGDRDRSKREPMGAAAAQGADVTIITDDNPRTEDPAAIRAAALHGARSVNPDALDVGGRRAAIAEGLRRAGSGGIVVVLGKGHEQGQIVGDEVIPFDDATVLAESWAQIGTEEL